MKIDFDELIYQITAVDASITPAEARALSGTSEEKYQLVNDFERLCH